MNEAKKLKVDGVTGTGGNTASTRGNTASSKHGRIVKLLTCGESGAGKSCLLLRFSENQFSTNYITTIGLDFKVKQITIDGTPIRLQVWDAAGQERFRSLVSSYFRGAHGIMLCYDVTDEDSFHSIRNWIKQIDDQTNIELPRIIVANKIDLVSQRLITTEEGLKLANDFKLEYFETSAKTGQGVQEAFTKLAHAALASAIKRDDCNGQSCSLRSKPSDSDNQKCTDACNRL
jgi:Ras-related protein Rab-8A